MKYIFDVSDGGVVRLAIRDDQGRLLREIPHPVRLSEVCRRLKRSRRHLYRYVARGWLSPVAKFSGELFFDSKDLEALERHTSSGRRAFIPTGMAPLFPEYDVKTLVPQRDADVILGRILERGNTQEIRWAVRQFPLARRRLFLSRQGRRLLSARAFHFWAWLWGPVARSKAPSWRKSGLAWGGAP